jgi:uncharacterized protein (DUF2147 family)
MNPTTDRRFDIDWLRIAATYLLLLFHTAMVFNPAPFFHIRNGEVSFFFLILCGFIGLWHMPLFFLLAGWSAHSSLGTRGTREFLRERLRRLLVPLVAGCILLMPSIKFLERSNGLDANYTGLYVDAALQQSFHQVIPSGLPEAAPFNESFLTFLPTFFTDPARFTWAHLWFIAYLLLMTVLYLPLLRWIQRRPEAAQRQTSAAWVYAPIVPLAVIQITMRPLWPGLPNLVQDWANVAYYTVFLLAGFLFARYPGFEAAAHGERNRSLAIAAAATATLVLGVVGVIRSPSIILALTAIAGWAWVVAFLGHAHQRLQRDAPLLPYLTESAFPVYLLHQSAIVLPGYFLIQLPIGMWAKFVLMLLTATGLTLSAYHFLVRRNSVLRMLCGMKRTGDRPATGRTLAATAALFIATVLALPSPAADAGVRTVLPTGLWHVEGGAAQVEIEECAGALCGSVRWLRSPFDEYGCPLQDRFNPDPALRPRNVVGIEILHNLEPSPDAPGVWEGGTIYDPGSGRTYHSTLQVIDENRLDVRGYVGFQLLGRTTSWWRVGSESAVCRDRG